MSEGVAHGTGGLGEVVRVLGSSSRVLARLARARYSCDLLTWHHREDFLSLWRTAEFIPGWFTEGSAAIFYRIIRAERPQTVVEIGSYLGRSTVFLASALSRAVPGGQVYSIDPHTGDRQQLQGLSAQALPSFDLFQQHCQAAGVTDVVQPMVLTSLEAAAEWTRPIDLLFVDGWHSYAAVIDDGEAWLPHLSKHGIVVFDDFLAYDEVKQAVLELADRGLFHLWGSIFGQAIGGASVTAPTTVQRALLLTPGGLGERLKSRGRR